MGAAPLWICFLAQGMSVLGDSFGQRTARVYHKNSRRHFIMSLACVSCVQMFLVLSAIQLAEPDFTLVIWTKNATDSKAPDYDFCAVHPEDEHCFHQGPLTIYKAVGDCPLLFTDEVVNVFYYLGEATLYAQPLGLILLVMAALSSAFIITPLQNWFNIGTTSSIPYPVIVMGIAGAVLCIVEREPPKEQKQKSFQPLDESTEDSFVGGGHSPVNVVHVGVTRRSLEQALQPDEPEVPWYVKAGRLVPLLVPFTLLSTTYAAYFIVMVYFNDHCYQNAWGYNAFDQVALPPFIFAMFFFVDSFQFTRTRFESAEDQKETFFQAIGETWREATSDRCVGLACCFTYRSLINARAVIYTYLAIQYDLNAVYLQLTLIRVALSWLGSLVLVLVIPRFIQTSQHERSLILDPVNIVLKVVGSVCIVTALILMQ